MGLFKDKKPLGLFRDLVAVAACDGSISDGEARFVWIVDQDSMTVSKREVTVSDGIGETAIVTEGLEMGETIATAGASYLAEGMQVRPWTE